MKKFTPLLLLAFLFVHCGPSADITKNESSLHNEMNRFSEDLLAGRIIENIPPSAKLIDIKIDGKNVILSYNKDFSYIPFRKENVDRIYDALNERIPGEYNFIVESMKQPIENLIPNFYRDKKDYDQSRQPVLKKSGIPTVRRSSEMYNNGLYDKTIVLWHSHGWYYSNNEKRWEWQRPRLFQSVEDLIPLSFTVPYLIPMLENAGANVFVPRERDLQEHEVIIDNTDQTYSEEIFVSDIKTGFGTEGYGHPSLPLKPGVNPFKIGNTRFISSNSLVTAIAEWIPDIPESGFYAVYISHSGNSQNVSDAKYIVNYYGGTKEFIVNQTICGGTWIYLGTFKFLTGINPETGRVTLINRSNENGKFISADAVRFGGGMGIVERGGSTSGRRKFFEGARYWLQAAGMPDTLIFNLNKEENDYNDDYQSRGEYANYLKGAPYGPNKAKNEKGLGVQVDLSLAFHTDAGITSNDTTVGTLAIYSLTGADSQYVFPDSVNRLSSRDLSDIIQTQIVNDLRELQDPAWNRRQLREAQYSESFRPNMPAMLLELLSHQNFLDMKYVLDPAFRFDVARAIYKGMLRFLSSQYNYDYVVQPLPVKFFRSEFTGKNQVKLSWEPQPDLLEPTAIPNRYILYTRIDDEDFDSGEIVYSNSVVKYLIPGKVYSFKITAVNSGGESFPSEILAAGIQPGKNKGNVLIVNGFDRVSGPASFNSGMFAGFLNDVDDGVPDKYDFNFTGRQYDYLVSSQWLTNDAPGHGASQANYEMSIIAGNTFDFPFIHGRALIENGFSFVSSSDESFGSDSLNISYSMVDYILGEEKETSWQKASMDSLKGKKFKAFTPDVVEKLTEYLLGGGNLFISGAYLGSELYADTITAGFAKNILKIKHVTTHASVEGVVKSVSASFDPGIPVKFNTTLNDSIYAVNSPGSISHMGEGEVLLRYSENQFSAAAGYKKDYGVAAFGFPFETIIGEQARIRVMSEVIKYLKL